ncbi:MAG: hypothetical protein ACI9XJ_001428 [Marivirga sp.]|jgi:hypothetical protein
MESNNTSCLNCEQPTQGLFCHHCGQKQGINRLTWGNVFAELQNRLFGFDNNFLRTVKDLTIRPQKVVQSSIDGIRVRYIGAVGYYFLMVTIYIIAMSAFSIDMTDFTNEINQSINPNATLDELAVAQESSTFIADNFRIVSFLIMPFIILGTWIFFKNKGFNFLETAVLTFYGQAHPIWLAIILLVVNKYTGNFFSISFISLFPYLYTIILAVLFYKGNKIWNLAKATMGMLLGFVLVMLAAAAITVIILSINPQILKSL